MCRQRQPQCVIYKQYAYTNAVCPHTYRRFQKSAVNSRQRRNVAHHSVRAPLVMPVTALLLLTNKIPFRRHNVLTAFVSRCLRVLFTCIQYLSIVLLGVASVRVTQLLLAQQGKWGWK